MSEIYLPRIVDAFALNPAIRYRPGMFMNLALMQMDVLRRANTNRPRLYVLPDDYNNPIGAYQTMEYQVRVTPKSYVWGMISNVFSAAFAVIDPINLYIKITDSCNGIPLQDDFTCSRAWQSRQNVAGDNRNQMLPHLLTQPRLILEPGLLAVEMANVSNAPLIAQMVLFTAEPCEVSVK